jgi:hypothetical protein
MTAPVTGLVTGIAGAWSALPLADAAAFAADFDFDRAIGFTLKSSNLTEIIARESK